MPHKDKEEGRKWRRKWWASLSPKRKREKQIKANERARKIKIFLAHYKIERGCKDCGYKKHHSALEFDHIKGKKKINIAFAKSINQAKKEIKKCNVVCSNCHRVRSWKRLYPCKPDIFKATYESPDIKSKDDIFIQHIQNHLSSGQVEEALQQIKQFARDEWVLSEEKIKEIILKHEEIFVYEDETIGEGIDFGILAKAIHSKMRENIDG